MNKQQLQHIIYEWVAKNFGTSEADDPSWSIEALAEHLFEKLNPIDYYGDKHNYIHAKFGDLQKAYHFTEEFTEKYPEFAKEYAKYWRNEPSMFEKPHDILEYVEQNNIPVNFYFNYIDMPARGIEDVRFYIDTGLYPEGL